MKHHRCLCWGMLIVIAVAFASDAQAQLFRKTTPVFSPRADVAKTVPAFSAAIKRTDIMEVNKELLEQLAACRAFYFKNVSPGSKDAAACLSEPTTSGGTNTKGHLCEFDKQAFSDYINSNQGCSQGYSPFTLVNRERVYVCQKGSGVTPITDPNLQLCLQNYTPKAMGSSAYSCELQVPRERVCGSLFTEVPSAGDNSQFYDVDNCKAEHFCCVLP